MRSLLVIAFLAAGCATRLVEVAPPEQPVAIPVAQTTATVDQLRAADPPSNEDARINWLPVVAGWLTLQDGTVKPVVSVENHQRTPGAYVISYPLYEICERVANVALARDREIYRRSGIESDIKADCMPHVITIPKPVGGQST